MSHPEIHPAVHSVGTGVGESIDDMVRRVQAMADAKFAEIRAARAADEEAMIKAGKKPNYVRGARIGAVTKAAKKEAAKKEAAKSKTAY
jgi:hypothetical protein